MAWNGPDHHITEAARGLGTKFREKMTWLPDSDENLYENDNIQNSSRALSPQSSENGGFSEQTNRVLHPRRAKAFNQAFRPFVYWEE